MAHSIEQLGQKHLWRQTRPDWIMAAIPMDTPTEAFGAFCNFVRIWRTKEENGLLPAWGDFELQDFEGWYGWYAVFDIDSRDPLRLKCRLWGTGLAGLHGHDMTNKYREVGQGGYDQLDDDFADALIEEKFIGYDEGVIYWQERAYIRLQLLTFPLATDGVHVDKILHVHAPPNGL